MSFLQTYAPKRKGKFLTYAVITSFIFLAGYAMKKETKITETIRTPSNKEIISLHNKVIQLERTQNEPLEKRNLRSLDNFSHSVPLDKLVLNYSVKKPSFNTKHPIKRTYKDLLYDIRDFIESHPSNLFLLIFGGDS